MRSSRQELHRSPAMCHSHRNDKNLTPNTSTSFVELGKTASAFRTRAENTGAEVCDNTSFSKSSKGNQVAMRLRHRKLIAAGILTEREHPIEALRFSHPIFATRCFIVEGIMKTRIRKKLYIELEKRQV